IECCASLVLFSESYFFQQFSSQWWYYTRPEHDWPPSHGELMAGERVLHGDQIPKWSRGPRTWTSAEETEDSIIGVRCAPDDTAGSYTAVLRTRYTSEEKDCATTMSFEADSPCPGRGSGWNPPPGMAENTTGAMGEDARGAVGENATGAIGNDAPGAMGRADWPCWNPFPGMAENTTGAMGEDAPGAVGGNATGAIGNDAPGALGGERWAAQDDSPEECPVQLAFDF
ncbi:unnamed protein product, partial [Ascophyllum nodosum]